MNLYFGINGLTIDESGIHALGSNQKNKVSQKNKEKNKVSDDFNGTDDFNGDDFNGTGLISEFQATLELKISFLFCQY